jgi:capsid protein
VSYQDVSGDFQNLGFAAALMCQTPKQAYCKIRQRNFIDNVVRPIFRRGLRAAILSGYLDLDIRRLEEFVNAAKFKGKRWPFVNPLVQAQTLIIMMEAGILAPQQVQDQLPDGVSIETLYTLMAEAKSEQQKHGLDFSDVDVTRPTINKGEPGQTAPTPEAGEDGAAAPAKTKVGNPVRARRERRRAETMAMIQSQGEGRDDAKG